MTEEEKDKMLRQGIETFLREQSSMHNLDFLEKVSQDKQEDVERILDMDLDDLFSESKDLKKLFSKNGETIENYFQDSPPKDNKERAEAGVIQIKEPEPLQDWLSKSSLKLSVSDKDVFGDEKHFKETLRNKCLQVFSIFQQTARKMIPEVKLQEEEAERKVNALREMMKAYDQQQINIENDIVDEENPLRRLGNYRKEAVVKDEITQYAKLRKILDSQNTNKYPHASARVEAFREQLISIKNHEKGKGLLGRTVSDKFENLLRACSYVFVVPAVAVYLSQGSLWKRTSGEVMLDKGLEIIDKKYTK